MNRQCRRILTLCVIAMVQFVPPVIAQQGSRFIALPDVLVNASLTVIRIANSARVVLVCANTDSTNAIRIGDDTVTATRGMRVVPGGTFMVTATPIVYGFSEGSQVRIACSEEIR